MNTKRPAIPVIKSIGIFLMIIGITACQSEPFKSGHAVDNVGKLEIKMLDMSYQPMHLTVAKAGLYTLIVQNTSTIQHDIAFNNGLILKVAPGESTETALEIPPTGLDYHCSLPGHAQAGMTGSIVVDESEKQAVHSHEPAITALSVKPKYVNPIAPALLPGKLHNIELTAVETDLAVAKDAVQNLWTFNGQVPGPVLHVKVGDQIRLHLVNPASNKLAHSIDFHASQVAWNDEMTSINPGEDKLYEWTADYAGVWMYHCGSNPALHHIASGMYGMVIVEPKAGLAAVDYEFALVQSEFYLGKQGHETDYQKAASAHPSPDFVTFNGVAMQYKDQPIEVETGKKIRIYVLNAGPNEDSAFHIVGTIFTRVIKEGIELKPDNKGHWGAQVVDLAPAQGAIVEFTTAEDGLYPIVTHAFNFVGKGALGLIKSGDGDPKH